MRNFHNDFPIGVFPTSEKEPASNSSAAGLQTPDGYTRNGRIEMATNRKIRFENSSGNVFADLGLPNA